MNLEPQKEFETLASWAKNSGIDLTVPGPEQPLFDGIVPVFRTHDLEILGPTPQAARLESSKVWAKRFMRKHNIPTAPFVVAEKADDARDLINEHFRNSQAPLVLKADGPALGKGVTIARNKEQGLGVVEQVMVQRIFGEAGAQILLEEFQEGWEVSLFTLVDRGCFVSMGSAQDYKEAYPNGPMTGGMAAISPHPRLISDEPLYAQIIAKIVEPTISGMIAEGCAYTGVLYFGLIITMDDIGRPVAKVLEYNTRLGDPEAQVNLPHIQGDFGEMLLAAATGELNSRRWPSVDEDEFTMGFVLASEGYPGKPNTGHEIIGIREVEQDGGVVFHAGTAMKEGKLVNAGGRVVMPIRSHSNLILARSLALRYADRIRFTGKWFRIDAGSEYVTAQ